MVGIDLFFDTLQRETNLEEVLQKRHAMHPSGRTGKPEEVASVVVLLASDAGGFISGQKHRCGLRFHHCMKAAAGWPALAEVEIAFASSDVLGESAVWSPTDNVVRWIDGSRALLQQLDPITCVHAQTALPGITPVGMIAQTGNAAVLILSNADGIAAWHFVDDTLRRIVHPELGREGVAYNDAKADREGRLWFGTFALNETDARGALWRYEAGSDPILVETGLAVANGPAFSPDGSRLYLSDSVGRRILAYDVAGEPPFLRKRRVFAVFSEQEGMPDGLTVDADGGVWCAQWRGACVTRFSADGERDRIISVPALQVTSLAFGGQNLATLYVTSARLDLTEAKLERWPLSGSLFAVSPGVRGLAETPVRLPVA